MVDSMATEKPPHTTEEQHDERTETGNPSGAGYDHNTAASEVPETSSERSHPDEEEIIRQVEFYFSDENLWQDLYLLEKCGGSENIPVKLRSICGFPKMRHYKPFSAVVRCLKKSTTLEVVEGNKIRRKVPLSRPNVLEKPEIAPPKDPNKAPREFLPKFQPKKKGTGFEEFFTDGPITPAEYEEERDRYGEGYAFSERMETVIHRYTSRRKMQSDLNNFFTKLMKYGGVDTQPNMFVGRLDERYLEGRDKHEVAAMKSPFRVAPERDEEDQWEVDFDRVARGFLSSFFPSHFATTDEEVEKVTNLMKNFYNYIILHDVCPEYAENIYRARDICDRAKKELCLINQLNAVVPGDFQIACSSLTDGYYSKLYLGDNEWHDDRDQQQQAFSVPEARIKILAAIAAYGNEEMFKKATDQQGKFTIVSEEDVGLEVTGIELSTEEAKRVCESFTDRLPFGQVKSLGKLKAKRWQVPNFAQYDVPKDYWKRKHQQVYEFWVEDEVLVHCFDGMKIEASVRKLDVGVDYMDNILGLHCSFYTYLPNELMKDFKPLRMLPPKDAQDEEEAQAALDADDSDVEEQDGQPGDDETKQIMDRE